MQAVASGDILQSCHLNGKQLHWNQALYTHCSKLAICQKDIAYPISLFSQAETAGVIGEIGSFDENSHVTFSVTV